MGPHPKVTVVALLAGALGVLSACRAGAADRPPAPVPPDARAPGERPAQDPEAVPLADLEADLDYRVELSLEPDDAGGVDVPVLRARVTATNVSPRPVRLEHSGCSVLLEAYRPAARDRDPVWRQEQAGSWPAGAEYGCPLPLILHVLQPGESYDGGEGVGRFEARVPVAEVYGDSLPAALYAFDALLRANRDTARLRVGEAVLPPSPFRLAAESRLDGFHYSAATTPVPGSPGAHEVRVVVRNAGLRPDLTRDLRTDCPIVLHAYPSATDQRTAPPDPAWADPRRCAPGIEPVRLTIGEERVLTRRLAAREVLGDSLPPGRYHLTAIVMLGESGGGVATRRVWLDAGAVELR